MAENKTRENRASVTAFLDGVKDSQKRKDCKAIARMMRDDARLDRLHHRPVRRHGVARQVRAAERVHGYVHGLVLAHAAQIGALAERRHVG